MSYDDIYEKVKEEYINTGSVKKAAENAGTTLVRAQRILITEGMWSSETSKIIGDLYESGMTVPEIAQKLYISEKTVQAYLPYQRGKRGYGGTDRSDEALRSEDYRKRQQHAYDSQVINRNPEEEINEIKSAVSAGNDINKKKEVSVMSDIKPENLTDVSFLKNNRKEETDGIYAMPSFEYIQHFLNPPTNVVRLSLELNTDYLSKDDMDILKRFGKVDKGITREILVPGEMSLHALNYAIQKAFGWQNSHLHCFKLSDESFQKLTGGKNKTDKYGFTNYDGKITDWVNLCGLYFRYPTDDLEDIYWDDDYEGYMSFKSWQKSKYTGPYFYGGEWEHYYMANTAAKDMLESMPEVSVNYDIHNSSYGKLSFSNKNSIIIPVEDATIMDFQYMGDGRFDELLERIPVSELLVPKSVYLDDMTYLSVDVHIEYQESVKEDIPVVPVTDELVYEYDYGDGWEVRIKMTDCYYIIDEEDDDDDNEYDDTDDFGEGDDDYDEEDDDFHFASVSDPENPVDDEFNKFLLDILLDEKPVCIEADGLPVMDDVGGVHGYIDYLKIIKTGDYPEKQETREWGRMMGWTGRMSKPKNIL